MPVAGITAMKPYIATCEALAASASIEDEPVCVVVVCIKGKYVSIYLMYLLGSDYWVWYGRIWKDAVYLDPLLPGKAPGDLDVRRARKRGAIRIPLRRPKDLC